MAEQNGELFMPELVKLLCNHKVAILNSVGLLLALAGVLLLFRYGMPYQVRRGGASYLLLEEADQQQINLERRYDRLAWLGLILILVATACQIVANWL
jgi:hypothetical protein